MTGRFVGIRPADLRALVVRHDLSPAEAWVLLWLALEADHRTGLWHGTQNDLAELVRIHRTNLRKHLSRLEGLGLIECHFPKGHKGSVRVWRYLDLVHLAKSQVANHYLRDDMTPDRNDTRVRNGHKSQNATCEVVNRYLWTREDAGQRVAASGLVESTLVKPVALGGRADEEADRARVGAENVIDFPVRKNITSPPSVGVTPSRAASSSPRAALAGEPHPLGASLPRVSAGGGSEATPEHPRSLNDTRPSISTTARGLRDPRAVGS